MKITTLLLSFYLLIDCNAQLIDTPITDNPLKTKIDSLVQKCVVEIFNDKNMFPLEFIKTARNSIIIMEVWRKTNTYCLLLLQFMK